MVAGTAQPPGERESVARYLVMTSRLIQAMFTAPGLPLSPLSATAGNHARYVNMLRAGLACKCLMGLGLMGLGSTAMASDKVRVFVNFDSGGYYSIGGYYGYDSCRDRYDRWSRCGDRYRYSYRYAEPRYWPRYYSVPHYYGWNYRDYRYDDHRHRDRWDHRRWDRGRWDRDRWDRDRWDRDHRHHDRNRDHRRDHDRWDRRDRYRDRDRDYHDRHHH
jgi:hypothetical protein